MPRCKNCKEKFQSKHFNQKYCFKSECVKVWVETAKVKNWKKEKKRLKNELETVQSLMKKAQKYFNSYIRERDKNKTCISCKGKLGKLFDAGHLWSSGGHKSVTFDEDNCHGQCKRCNHYLSGNLIHYSQNIVERIGQQRTDELAEKANQIRKFTREELRQIIETYKEKKKNLE